MRVISRPAPRAISGAVLRSWPQHVPLFEDPDMTLGLGSFTAFVIVPLNEQTREGCGQTAVLPRRPPRHGEVLSMAAQCQRLPRPRRTGLAEA